MTFTSKLAYNEACDKLAAWEGVLEMLRALKDHVSAQPHFDEAEQKEINANLDDWIADREGNLDIQDLRDAVVEFDHHEEAA